MAGEPYRTADDAATNPSLLCPDVMRKVTDLRNPIEREDTHK
jgi:hypothetical protein